MHISRKFKKIAFASLSVVFMGCQPEGVVTPKVGLYRPSMMSSDAQAREDIRHLLFVTGATHNLLVLKKHDIAYLVTEKTDSTLVLKPLAGPEAAVWAAQRRQALASLLKVANSLSAVRSPDMYDHIKGIHIVTVDWRQQAALEGGSLSVRVARVNTAPTAGAIGLQIQDEIQLLKKKFPEIRRGGRPAGP